jgi:hypothetical protein
MADPLSITASIIAVTQLSSVVLSHLREVKQASPERKALILEISEIRGILDTLKDSLDDKVYEDWAATIKFLNLPDGPLFTFQSLLDTIKANIGADIIESTALRRARKALVWPFRKKDIEDLLRKIERQKTLLSLALSNDHLALSKAILGETHEILSHVSAVESLLKTESKLAQESRDRYQGKIIYSAHLIIFPPSLGIC